MEDLLPIEIQSKILSYVTLEHDVLSCKLVSKTWKTLLSHRKLKGGGLLVCIGGEHNKRKDVKLWFGYYDGILSGGDEDHDDKRSYRTMLANMEHYPLVGKSRPHLIGSCDGLVCLSIHSNVYVFNPLTGEHFNLQKVCIKRGPIDMFKRLDTVSGFGYNPSGRNYKLVRIQYYRRIGEHYNPFGLVYRYTLGGKWRIIGDIDYSFSSAGVYWNGSLHWLDDKQRKIVVFDLADETFRYLPTTPPIGEGAQLKLLGGCLSVVNTGMGTNIWLFKKKLKNDDVVVEDGYKPWNWCSEFSKNKHVVFEEGYKSWNWCLEFSIPPILFSGRWLLRDSCEPYAITKNNEVFLWYKKYDKFGGSKKSDPVLCLWRYDSKTKSLKEVLDWGTSVVSNFLGLGIPHVNSIVSLKALGVDSKTTAEFVAERM